MAGVLFALATVPVAVMLACGLVLVVASFWRLSSRRAGGSGVVPMAFLWTTLGALVLSAGAVAVRGVLPQGSAPTAAPPAPTVQLGSNPARFSSPLSAGQSPSGAVSAPASIVGSVSPSSLPSLSQAGLTPPPALAAPRPPLAPSSAPLSGTGAPGSGTSGTGGAAPAAGGSSAGGAPASNGGAAQPQTPAAAASPSAAPTAAPSRSAAPATTSGGTPSRSAASPSPTPSPSKGCGTNVLGIDVAPQSCN
ncbi:hypothetical protein [Sinomonas susongensis]|uniref:hypothetical protein n=1 Tax=Sinomonas susongensis TaxID=1324851 RepID=UPI0011094011|nr:hypothetical protein [Sinomonas susongensis]